MTKLGVAVIGTGQWGKNHARVYKELPSTELIAVCDVNAERAKAMAQQYGVKAYSDSTEMLKDKDIQAVNVCTWSTILAQEAMKVLNAGKHVLVEKPMATNPEQARQLVKTAEENGLHLTVGFLMRFIPGLQHIRQSVENKKIGELVCVTAKRVSQWPERIGDVGVVKDTAIHDIDVMRFISKQDPVSRLRQNGQQKNTKIRRLRPHNAHLRKRRIRIHRNQLANTLQNPHPNRNRHRSHNAPRLQHTRLLDRRRKLKASNHGYHSKNP